MNPLDELEFVVEKHRLVDANLSEEKVLQLAKKVLKYMHNKDRPVYVGSLSLELKLSLERTEAIIGVLIDSKFVELTQTRHAETIGGRECDKIVSLCERSSPTIARSFI